jgi:hypothetical protein
MQFSLKAACGLCMLQKVAAASESFIFLVLTPTQYVQCLRRDLRLSLSYKIQRI